MALALQAHLLQYQVPQVVEVEEEERVHHQKLKPEVGAEVAEVAEVECLPEELRRLVKVAAVVVVATRWMLLNLVEVEVVGEVHAQKQTHS